MNLTFIINTSAQAHTWKNILLELGARGHKVNIIARDYGSTTELLSSFGFNFRKFKPLGSRTGRIFGTLDHFQKCYRLASSFQPSLIIGFGVDASITARRFRVPSIVFNDSEPIGVQNKILAWTASSIITPDCFQKDLGKKQIRINGYKELSYLRPDRFQPDSSILAKLGLAGGEEYVILRFNVFDAVHDVGKHGFTTLDQRQLVESLGKYVRVFISPEGKLSPELEKYSLPVPQNRIHDALYYAKLLVTDTQTMTTEAALLGVPAVRCNNFVGPDDMGVFLELEKKYDAIYSFSKSTLAVQKALELVQRPNLKEEWDVKRQRILADKLDFVRFFVDFIENYPASLQKYHQPDRLP